MQFTDFSILKCEFPVRLTWSSWNELFFYFFVLEKQNKKQNKTVAAPFVVVVVVVKLPKADPIFHCKMKL